MRRRGLYLGGSLDSGIPAFFAAARPKMNAVQVYFNDPMRFYPASRYADPKVVEKIKRFMADFDVRVYVHCAHVVSIVNHAEKSAECVKRHLAHCDGLGIDHVVVHSGSWKQDLFAGPVEEWCRFLEPLASFKATVLLENMAYRDGAMTAAQLNAVCERVKCGICLDTVHAWASTMVVFEELDPQFVKLIHLNQTKDGRGSGKDRHCDNHLNEGVVPQTWLQSVVEHCPQADLISEYAGPEWEKELLLVEGLLNAAAV